MPLDGLFLSKLINELKVIEGARVQKINQVGNNTFLFVLHKQGKHQLLISLERNEFRLALTDKEYSPILPKTFLMVLRKYFEGGIIDKIEMPSLDRIVKISVNKLNDFLDNSLKYLYVELMGKNSNLIITDSNNEIIDSFKRVGLSLDNKRVIIPHATYITPTDERINFLTADINTIKDAFNNIQTSQEINAKFSGLSPVIAKWIISSINPLGTLLSLKDSQVIPTIYNKDNKDDFYFIPISEKKLEFKTLSEMLENFFYQKTITNSINEKNNNLKTHIIHLIKKLETKIVKLEEDLDEADKALIYQKYGNLIINNLYNINDTHAEGITLFDYETNKDIIISLDNKITIKENAKKFFTKYQKGKTGKIYINEQIEKAKNEIEYLELIKTQIEVASLKDIDEITDELIQAGYIKANKKEKLKAKKVQLQTYYTSDNIKICVGKNNIQNDYLSNVLASKGDYWFHIKDGPGSHVVLFKSEDLTEEDIRMAANLAAYNSKFQQSSSVPVIYTKVKNLKKIPGKKNCFLTYKEEKTIYIDPDINLINEYKTSI